MSLVERTIPDFGSNPGNLGLTLALPQPVPGPVPLVLLLHGCRQGGLDYARGSGWWALAERHGFALAIPQQRAENNPNACFNWFEEADITRGSGEALSLRQAVAHAVTLGHADPARVFVTGLSAGAAMAAVVLAAYPEVFAAGALVAGVPYRAGVGLPAAFAAMKVGCRETALELGQRVRQASSHAGPWPALSVWQGAEDTTVHPRNAQALAAQWTQVHGVAWETAAEHTRSRDTCRQWRDARGRVAVELHLLEGRGHGQPVDPGAGPEQGGEHGPFLLPGGPFLAGVLARSWGLLPG